MHVVSHTLGRSMKINNIFNDKRMNMKKCLSINMTWMNYSTAASWFRITQTTKKRRKKTSESTHQFFFFSTKIHWPQKWHFRRWTQKQVDEAKQKKNKIHTSIFVFFFFCFVFIKKKSALVAFAGLRCNFFAQFIANSRYKKSLWLCLHFDHW